ncbi:hypothetical protein PCANC_13054 [Puccinia coronata f. sp. avenae]|uniref:Uncharacterized protein n=1 Tax=Puccinia coronata f. sp. avenae TaxID=200324 RepID=A0A2N5SUI9_9BASI|nr:hypothetical protein PCANC_13054 [Puccinia coronata f. sp. avenae]PLW16897.1 hypothetical protein PCASD_16387 [Puccinia coronata f. sp. avenae]
MNNFFLLSVCITAGINRSNTAARAVLEQPCSTGGRTDTVRPEREPTGRTDLSDRSRLVLCNRSQELIGQACPTRRQVLRSDSACPTTGRTRLFEHRSNCRVRPVNASSDPDGAPSGAPLGIETATLWPHEQLIIPISSSLATPGNSAHLPVLASFKYHICAFVNAHLFNDQFAPRDICSISKAATASSSYQSLTTQTQTIRYCLQHCLGTIQPH